MGINRGAGAGGDHDDDAGSVGGASALTGVSGVTGLTGFASRALAPRSVAASLSLSLAALPAPRNKFELVAPPPDEDDAGAAVGPSVHGGAGTAASVPDKGEEAAAAEAAAAVAAAEEARKASSVLRRGPPPLPRPLVLDEDALAPPSSSLLASATAAAAVFPPLAGPGSGADADADASAASSDSSLSASSALPQRLRELASAEALVREEALRMIKADASSHPVRHVGFKRPRRVAPLEDVPLDALDAAAAIVKAEADAMRMDALLAGAGSAAGAGAGAGAFDGSSGSNGPSLDPAALLLATVAVESEFVFVPSAGGAVRRAAATPAQCSELARDEFTALSAAFARDGGRLGKIETRLGVLTAGYEARTAALGKAMAALTQAQRNKEIELAACTRRAHDEAAALPARLAAASEAHEAANAREQALQRRYAAALSSIADLKAKLTSAGMEV